MKPDLAAALARIETAAIACARCPHNHEMGAGNYGAIVALARQGVLRVEISGRNWRTVTILTGPHAGARTMANPDATAKLWQTIDTSTPKKRQRRHLVVARGA